MLRNVTKLCKPDFNCGDAMQKGLPNSKKRYQQCKLANLCPQSLTTLSLYQHTLPLYTSDTVRQGYPYTACEQAITTHKQLQMDLQLDGSPAIARSLVVS